MSIRLIKIVPVLIALGLLSGCAGMNGDFGCHATAGSGCTPVSQVNAQAQAGDFDNETSGGGRIQLPASSHTFSYAATQSSAYQGVTPMPGQPVRTTGRVQRLWIAPYQDLAHNYHEPSYVYTVLEKPHWIGVPAKEINTRETEQDD